MQQDEAFQKAVLQGEILALLHDVGKLHWRFVGPATVEKKGKEFKQTGDLSSAHTLMFLATLDYPKVGAKTSKEDTKLAGDEKKKEAISRLDAPENLPPLQRLLLQKIAWLQVGGQSLSALGSLLALHHEVGYGSESYKEEPAIFSLLQKKFSDNGTVLYSNPGLCTMHADTVDSSFSKGDSSGLEQLATIHLSCPQGGMDGKEITKEGVERDTKNLADAIVEWGSGNPDEWDVPTLLQKRNSLREIVRKFGEKNLAETRIPNNDVSLWQHSASVAGLFKALLASHMLSGEWESLLHNGELDYTAQRIAFLSLQWDEDAYLARSVRPFEILGRKARLYKLAQSVKRLVEDELCLGNEVYRDHKGICFAIPDLNRDGCTDRERGCLQQIKDRVAGLCNGEIIQGDLPWKLSLHQSGLVLTGMISFWGKPFESMDSCIAFGPDKPVWEGVWEKRKGPAQICPRCGLRPAKWSLSRTGSDADDALCPECRQLRKDGWDILKELQKKGGDASVIRSFASDSFGIDGIPNINAFWSLMGDENNEGQEGGDTRFALIQGVIPMDSLHDGSFFDSLLTPPGGPKKGDPWSELKKKVGTAWSSALEGDSKETTEVLGKLLGFKSNMEKNGWCADAPEGFYVRTWVDHCVFEGAEKRKKKSFDEQVEQIAIWGQRQHPAPSRLTRMWDQVRGFTRSVFELALKKGIAFLPLTCDAGAFQILVPSKTAFELMQEIKREWEKRFSRVRHLLPLHLSASVFYHKAPLYIAMDAAKRFRRLADMDYREEWTLKDKAIIKDKEKGKSEVSLLWEKPDGRTVRWTVPSTLPDGRPDEYHTWFAQKGSWAPVSLGAVKSGCVCLVRPATFDFEILDASSRRYDIRYNQGKTLRRPHYMMPRTERGPRPYPIEELEIWDSYKEHFSKSAQTQQAAVVQSQLKIALELVARIHMDWDSSEAEVFAPMIKDILVNTLGEEKADALLGAAVSGTLFDLFEWFDFLA